MRTLKPSISPAELIASLADGHTASLYHDWRHVLGAAAPYPKQPIREVFAAYLTSYPTPAATKEMVALHEAGHYIAFERLGMIATTAAIRGSAFGRDGWSGGANAIERPDHHWVMNARRWGLALLWNEAIAGLAGPIAEEILGGGDALGSVSELAGAALWVACAAELAGQDGGEALRQTVRKAIALVERHEPGIRDIAGALEHKKSISRFDRPVKKILQRVLRGVIANTPLSDEGQTLSDKIMGALAQLEFLGLPVVWAAAEELEGKVAMADATADATAARFVVWTFANESATEGK